MPWVPYSKSELTGVAFACSRDFLRVQLRMGGCTEAQIDDYFAYLATLPDDEPETTAEERESNLKFNWSEMSKMLRAHCVEYDMRKILRCQHGTGEAND